MTGIREPVSWISLPQVRGSVVPPIFQAGHAGSIPVARSTTAAQVRVMII
jgi:hypothetical protein